MVQVSCEVMYAIKVAATINDVNCFGDSTGEIVIDSINNDDGNAPFDVQWGGVDSSALSAGTYEVHIVDAIGCLKTEVYVVAQGDQIIADEVLSDLLCHGDTNGSITIDPSGGTGILDWDFHNMGQVNFLNGLAAGSYLLEVEVSAENYQPQLSCTGELTTVDLLISGGTIPYSILWDDGNTNLNRVVGAGSYTVQVTDTNGCVAGFLDTSYIHVFETPTADFDADPWSASVNTPTIQFFDHHSRKKAHPYPRHHPYRLHKHKYHFYCWRWYGR